MHTRVLTINVIVLNVEFLFTYNFCVGISMLEHSSNANDYKSLKFTQGCVKYTKRAITASNMTEDNPKP